MLHYELLLIQYKNASWSGAMVRIFLSFYAFFLLVSCSSVRPIGNVGAQKLAVYSVADNDFLSASRMLLVLDKKGHVVAFTGGTVSGPGTIGLQAAGTLATATSIVMTGRAVQKGLQNVGVHGNVSTEHTINIPDILKK